MMRSLIVIVGVLIGVISVVDCCMAAETAKIEIKFATMAPKGSVFDVYRHIKKAVAEQTNGAVNFKVYYGGVQGDEADVIRKIKFGQLNGGGFTGHGLGKIVPEVCITDLPYLYWNYEEVRHVRENLKEEMDRSFAKKGFIVLGWSEIGFAYLFSKVPITSVDVARKQKWWMWAGNPMQEEIFKEMDITPVSLSVTDVMTSLSTKMIDAAPSTPYMAVASRWYTRFKYMNEYPVSNSLTAMLVTKAVWDKISPDHQKIIRSISKKYYEDEKTIQAKQRVNEQSIQVLKKAGIQIVAADIDGEMEKYILGAAGKARENLVGKLYSKELLQKTISILNEYRRKHPESKVYHVE